MKEIEISEFENGEKPKLKPKLERPITSLIVTVNRHLKAGVRGVI